MGGINRRCGPDPASPITAPDSAGTLVAPRRCAQNSPPTVSTDRTGMATRQVHIVLPTVAICRPSAGVVQAKAPAHLPEGNWPIEALLAHVAPAKPSEHMPLNRQAGVMARLGVPIDRSVLADWMGRTGALIALVVDRMAALPKTEAASRYEEDQKTIRGIVFPTIGCVVSNCWAHELAQGTSTVRSRGSRSARPR